MRVFFFFCFVLCVPSWCLVRANSFSGEISRLKTLDSDWLLAERLAFKRRREMFRCKSPLRNIWLCPSLTVANLVVAFPFLFSRYIFGIFSSSLKSYRVNHEKAESFKSHGHSAWAFWCQAPSGPKLGFSYVLLCVSSGLFVKQHSIPYWKYHARFVYSHFSSM